MANRVVSFYKFEEQQYKFKNSYDNFADKDSEIRCLSSNDDKILALLSNGVMLQGKVRFENSKDHVRTNLDQVNLHFHSGPIVGMDVCIRKPLIATASKDKTIKIWNYEDKTVETPKS